MNPNNSEWLVVMIIMGYHFKVLSNTNGKNEFLPYSLLHFKVLKNSLINDPNSNTYIKASHYLKLDRTYALRDYG